MYNKLIKKTSRYETYVPYSKSKFAFHQDYQVSKKGARITPPRLTIHFGRKSTTTLHTVQTINSLINVKNVPYINVIN